MLYNTASVEPWSSKHSHDNALHPFHFAPLTHESLHDAEQRLYPNPPPGEQQILQPQVQLQPTERTPRTLFQLLM
jgi:hypothetical protein